MYSPCFSMLLAAEDSELVLVVVVVVATKDPTEYIYRMYLTSCTICLLPVPYCARYVRTVYLIDRQVRNLYRILRFSSNIPSAANRVTNFNKRERND